MPSPSSTRVQVVAVVDDDASMRNALRYLFLASGYDPRVFGSAREFLGSIETQEYACLVLDLMMPEMDGLALQEHVLEIAPSLPIVFITAQAAPAPRAQATAAGAVAYLIKPFHNADLLGAVRRAIQGGPPVASV